MTEYDAYTEECSCGYVNRANFPDGINAPAQYGNKVKALVYMNQYQLIPLERTANFFADQMGLPVNKSSINNWVNEAAEKLLFFEEQSKNDLLNSSILHADETGIVVEKQNSWLHCLSNETTTLYDVSPKRGIDAMNSTMVLPLYNGYLVHDFWGSYFNYDCIHIMCNAHILRELTYLYEVEKQEWANKIKKLLQKSLLKRDDSQSGLSYEQITSISKTYDKILLLAENECPINSDRLTKTRGRIPQTKSRNLLNRLIKYKSSILMFLYSKDIPFTNNQGERDLRMVKVHQKISGCFRTWNGAKNFCRIRSFITTMIKRGISPKDALAEVFFRGT